MTNLMKIPALNPKFFDSPLCIPITLLLFKYKIGEPEEPGSAPQ